MGIPAPFWPEICVSRYKRGENAFKERRAELRRVAQAEVEFMVRQARSALLRSNLEQLTKLTAAALTSTQAKDILAALPTVEQLLPSFDLEDLKKKYPLLSEGGEDEGLTVQ